MLLNHSVLSNLLRSHGLQYARILWFSPYPRVCSNSCPLNQYATQPYHPLLSPSPPAFNFSQHQILFQWVGSLHHVAKKWNFSVSISVSNEYSGLISFRIDWFDLAVQGTLKSVLQNYNLKTQITWCSAFFMVQLSHSYMTTRKIIALTRQPFVGSDVSAF